MTESQTDKKSIKEDDSSSEVTLRSSPPKLAFLEWYPSSLPQESATLAWLFVLLFVIRFDGFMHIATHFIGGVTHDAGLYVWLVQSNVKNLLSEPWFNTQAFFPYTRTLAWSDNFILPSVVAKLLLSCRLPLAFAYNVLILGAQFLNGYCTYRLAYRLSGVWFGSFVAGAAFMSSSFLAGNMGHPQLQFAFWLPIGISALFSFLAKRSIISAVPLGLVVTGAFLTTVYYALFLAFLFPVLLIITKLLRPNHLRLKEIGTFALGLFLGIIPLIPFLPPYFDVRGTFGARALYEAHAFSATALSYFSAPLHSLIYSFSSNWSHAEANLFPGVMLWVGVIIAYRRLINTNRMKRSSRLLLLSLFFTFSLSVLSATGSATYAYLCGLFMWISIGLAFHFLYKLGSLERRLGFDIFTDRNIIATLLFTGLATLLVSFGPLGTGGESFAPGLFTILYGLIPGYNSLRAISRIGIVVILSLSLLIPFVFKIVRSKRDLSVAISIFICALIVIENYHTTYAREHQTLAPKPFADLNEIAKKKEHSAVLVLPMTNEVKQDGSVKSWSNFAKHNVSAMQWSSDLGMPTMNGYSGQRSAIILRYPGKLSNFPDQRSINSLELIPNLRYIIYLPTFDPRYNAEEFPVKVARFANHLTQLSNNGDEGYLLEFHPTTWVTDTFFLRVPSYPQQELSIELKAFGGEENEQVELFMRKHFDHKPFDKISVKTDNQFHHYSITMPQTPDRVRPLLVSFRAPDGVKLYMRERTSIDLP